MEPIWEEVQRKAGPQAGHIHRDQLFALGMSRSQVRSWVARGRLVCVHPRVYAVGYKRTDLLARQWAGILYAGPGAYLTGMSGAHLRGLINHPPESVVVATPRPTRPPVPALTILRGRPAAREIRDGLPVAPVPDLLLQLAAEADFNLVRKALAGLDFRRELDLIALRYACGRGRPGSAALRRAIAHHLPQLAYTNSPLEEAFLILLDAHRLPLPRVNVRVHGVLVDAFWPDLALVVELDGVPNHGTAAQRRRDARSDATLRAHGLTVLRFTYADVHEYAEATLRRLAGHGVRA